MASKNGTEIQQSGVNNGNGKLPLRRRVETMLETMVPPLTSQCCIFRVPKVLRNIKESAYTPLVISVGPFHHNCYKYDDKLHFMEKQKVRYLHHVLQVCNVSLDSLLTSIKIWETRVRNSYGEHVVWLDSDEFVMMVLLDGLFIIEYFKRNCFPELRDENDKVYLSWKKLWDSIYYDLILLENQLPFFVLESLYDLVYPTGDPNQRPFLRLSCRFFTYFCGPKIKVPELNFLHFTDLMRTYQLNHSSFQLDPCVNKKSDEKYISSYRAQELEECGIKFKASSSKYLLDIQFKAKEGVFLIPKLEIHYGTESMIRNMMALEQYLYMDQRYICDYVYLMDTLIDTSKDAALLVRQGIIENRLGNHGEVAALFNSLNHEIVYTHKRHYFSKLVEELNRYYEKPRHKWKASFKRDYFSSPWQIASVIAAITLLVLTFIQTICAIIQALPNNLEHSWH